mmetsp:Transcript_80596/g.224251  ORF Transcript_80596/g.224251 Transcript_80596/m.224251 type:complete len:209 (-) Transcript_80596:75-701(-)
MSISLERCTFASRYKPLCPTESSIDFVMPKSLIFASPAQFNRMFPGLMSLWRSLSECRCSKPFKTSEAMQASMQGGTLLWRRNKSAKLPQSINSRTRCTCPSLDAKPACHCTKYGQPSELMRPRTSLSNNRRSSLRSTFKVFTAIGRPAVLMMPRHTLPLAPEPKNPSSSSAMSSAEILYSRPSHWIPATGETRMPDALCSMDPVMLL